MTEVSLIMKCEKCDNEATIQFNGEWLCPRCYRDKLLRGLIKNKEIK